jgi:hypothetical protein
MKRQHTTPPFFIENNTANLVKTKKTWVQFLFLSSCEKVLLTIVVIHICNFAALITIQLTTVIFIVIMLVLIFQITSSHLNWTRFIFFNSKSAFVIFYKYNSKNKKNFVFNIQKKREKFCQNMLQKIEQSIKCASHSEWSPSLREHETFCFFTRELFFAFE